MDELIRELERAVAAGDMQAAVRLAAELIRSGTPAAAIPLIVQVIKQFPEAAFDLISKLGPKELKDVISKLVDEGNRQVLGELKKRGLIGRLGGRRPKWGMKFVRAVSRGVARGARVVGKLLFRGAAALARFAAVAVSRGIAFLGPVGFAAAAVVVVLLVVLGAYLAYRYFSSSDVASSINCDCDNTEAPNIGGEAVRQCLRAESSVKARAASGQLKVDIVDGKIANGNLDPWGFCDAVTSGPAAWPVVGRPAHH